MGNLATHHGREMGAWYEIRSVIRTVIQKEAAGKDASFERDLLTAWKKVDGYSDPRFYDELAHWDNGHQSAPGVVAGEILPTSTSTPPDFDISGIIAPAKKRGRPRLPEGEGCRRTVFYQKKRIQGKLF